MIAKPCASSRFPPTREMQMLSMHLSRGRRGSGSLGLPEDWTDNDEAERFMRAAARRGHMGRGDGSKLVPQDFQ
jgi:hypothetical protein